MRVLENKNIFRMILEAREEEIAKLNDEDIEYMKQDEINRNIK